MNILQRFILKKLIEWKESKYRKPLILKGARQVGKTYILKQFGKENYEGVAYFNFDHDEDLYNLFENTKDPKRILEQLAFIYGKAIIPGKTLIIFDEIQECPNALNSLKYFYEEADEYHIAYEKSKYKFRKLYQNETIKFDDELPKSTGQPGGTVVYHNQRYSNPYQGYILSCCICQ